MKRFGYTTKTKINLLNTIESIQFRLGIREVQPKDIISFSSLSSQTIYTSLQGLVYDGFLNKRGESKFKYYSITSKGKSILKKARESKHDSLIEPLIKNMANQLIEEYPDEFENISYNIVVEYLSKQFKILEDAVLSAALEHFVNQKNKVCHET